MITPGRSSTHTSAHSRHVSKPGFTQAWGVSKVTGLLLKGQAPEAGLGRRMGLAFGERAGGTAKTRRPLGLQALRWFLSPRVGFGREQPLKVAEYLPLAFRAEKLCHLPGAALSLPGPPPPPGCCPWS